MNTEFKLPELGENITQGRIVNVLVKVGDVIEVDQPLLEVETDKALVEVPSSVRGKVKTIHLESGQDADVGQTILTVEAAEGEPAPAAKEETPAPEKKEAPPAEEKKAPAAKEEAPAPAEVAAPGDGEPPAAEARSDPPAPAAAPSPKPTPPPTAPRGPAAAAPSVRRLAREIGVDIDLVPVSGSSGRVSAADVKRYAREMLIASPVPGAGPAAPHPPLPDFTRWGEVESIPMDGIRRATSEQMSRAWSAAPRVTQCDKTDITELEKLRKLYAPKAEAMGGRLTVTSILVKMLASALKVFPKFNASVDPEGMQIIFKKYCHIGVAVDTPAGLMVPVIRDADRKNILEISVEVQKAAARARERKTTLDELQGGSFTITNLGGIGGTYFTPVVNWPEVAILGISRARTEPVWVDGQWEPRLMLPLQLSYDHRLIDGADGIRFLRWIAEAMENPFLLSLEG